MTNNIEQQRYPVKANIAKTLGSIFFVLLLMPLGHALMIIMEHILAPTTLHYCAFALGAVGMLIAISGVFAKGDTRQTIMGLIGGLLFWTGWVEFLFMYYAWRYGVHCDLIGSGIVETVTTYIDGVGVSHDFTINGRDLASFTEKAELKAVRGSRPEYLILPATFGLWMMVMMFYLFCTRTGCRFFNWIQSHSGIKGHVQLRPITHLSSMVTFMEINMLLWSCYLLLMFCYDPIFLGSGHIVTFTVGFACLIASGFMFVKELRISAWGANIRMAIATVIVFWTFVEVVARNGILNEVWVDPLNHMAEMLVILGAFIIVSVLITLKLMTRKKEVTLR